MKRASAENLFALHMQTNEADKKKNGDNSNDLLKVKPKKGQTECKILAFGSPSRHRDQVMTSAKKVNQKKREHEAAEEIHKRIGRVLNLTSCPPGRFWVQLHWQNQTPDGKPNVSQGMAQKVHIYTFWVAVLQRHRLM